MSDANPAADGEPTSALVNHDFPLLRKVMEQIPAIVWTTDHDLRFTSSKGTDLVHLGLKPDQVVGVALAISLGQRLRASSRWKFIGGHWPAKR